MTDPKNILKLNTQTEKNFLEWWTDMENGCPTLVLNNDEEFARAVWNAATKNSEMITVTNENIIKMLHRAEAAEQKAAAAEEALRDIACFLSCGGYNDVGLVEFDPAHYAKKIKETITYDTVLR
jgi:hypothetical protein